MLIGKSIASPLQAPEILGISELLHCIERASADQALPERKLAEAIIVMQSWRPGLNGAGYEFIRLIAHAFTAYGPDLKFNCFNRAPCPAFLLPQLLKKTVRKAFNPIVLSRKGI
jgi:hypothetical protein